MFRSTGRETSFSTEGCKTVVQSVVPQMQIHDMGPSIVFMKPWALTILYGKPGNSGENSNGTVHPGGLFPEKKSNTFRGITFFPLSPKRPKFSVPFVGITSARRQVERKRKIYRYFVNGTIQACSCFRFQKKYQYLQMVNAICLKMVHAFFLIGLVPGLCVCSPGGTAVGPLPGRSPLGVNSKFPTSIPVPSYMAAPPPPPHPPPEGVCFSWKRKKKKLQSTPS